MSIKLKFAGVFLCLLSTLTLSQAQITSQISVYDYTSDSYYELSTSKFKTSVKRSHTEHYCGEKKIAKLNQAVPTANLIDDTEFTNLIPLANVEKDLTFPYTTGVKVVLPQNNDKHQASGVMVGENFVLTTAHSVLRKNSREVLFEELAVIASFDNVLNGDKELRSSVSKIYFIKDWKIGGGEDLVLLELEEPIGAVSGWMSIGFEEEDNLKGALYHKMSYPAYNTPYNDKPYTGNDLHISYGVVDYVSEEFIGVQNHLYGLGGESGSPIFKSQSDNEFITYGVLTYLGNYNHTRFRPSIYYAFESILNNAESGKLGRESMFEVNIYPNPTTDFITIDSEIGLEDEVELSIFSATGKRMINQKLESNNTIATHDFEKGVYHILLRSQEAKESFSFVVQ